MIATRARRTLVAGFAATPWAPGPYSAVCSEEAGPQAELLKQQEAAVTARRGKESFQERSPSIGGRHRSAAR